MEFCGGSEAGMGADSGTVQRPGLRRRTHLLHGVLALGTMGAWTPVWALHWIAARYGGRGVVAACAFILAAGLGLSYVGLRHYEALPEAEKLRLADERREQEATRDAEREARRVARQQEEAARQAELERLGTEREAREQREATRRAARAQAAAGEEAARRIPLAVVSWHWGPEHGFAVAEGEVKNVSPDRLDNVMAMVTFRTSSGELVTSSDALLEYQALLPGQTSPFRVMAGHNPAMAGASLRFKTLRGRELPARGP